jgi:hypothetical protein
MDVFGRRFYARMVSEIALRSIYARNPFFDDRGDSALFNRYFDIIIVMKMLPNLLVGGFTIVLQMVVGFLLVSSYHPLLLAFNVGTALLIWLVWMIWGKRAIRSAVELSHRKHASGGVARVARPFERFLQERTAYRRGAVAHGCDHRPLHRAARAPFSSPLLADPELPVHLRAGQRGAARPRRLAGDPGTAVPGAAGGGGAGAVSGVHRCLAAGHLPELFLRCLRRRRRAVPVLRVEQEMPSAGAPAH